MTDADVFGLYRNEDLLAFPTQPAWWLAKLSNSCADDAIEKVIQASLNPQDKHKIKQKEDTSKGSF